VFGLTAFVVVALGGFGSIPGAFIAGIIVGLVQVLAGVFISPSLKFAVVLAIYLLVVLVRPQGLLGEW
jgi:branched-chain amino acid transport system permease protein